MRFSIQKLHKHHSVENFDCGDESLNTYLARYALQNQERHKVGVTYAAIEESVQDAVRGYYTLAASSFPKATIPPDTARRLAPYANVPSLLLARLAVDKRFQKHGLGRQLLKDALRRCLIIREEIGCRCLMVDAYPSAVTWYQSFGFIALEGAAPNTPTQKMILDLKTAEAALG